MKYVTVKKMLLFRFLKEVLFSLIIVKKGFKPFYLFYICPFYF